LQDLSDNLPRREEETTARFEPEVAVCSRGKERDNGDRCFWFAGTRNRYYVLLCDGMGTGEGAAYEAKTAGSILRRMLMAGYPTGYALQSLNSLCVLRGSAGAVTVDLAEIRLDTGAVALYKWGAMPSYAVSRLGTEKIGTAGSPPGLSVTECRETVDRLSLRRGETLVMLSDGVDGEDVLRRAGAWWREPAGEVAASVLETVDEDSGDDATAVVVRLRPLSSATG
jgi:stage II sporulation protein E